MAMFGWTDPKMPAHYIAKANREKLGISGMDKIVAFDQSQSLDVFGQPIRSEQHGNAGGEQSSNFRVVTSGKKRCKFQGYAWVWCARRDSNPHDVTHCHLKAARLPIPPRALKNGIMSARERGDGADVTNR